MGQVKNSDCGRRCNSVLCPAKIYTNQTKEYKMGLFSAFGQVIAAPITIAKSVVDDCKGKDEMATGAAILTLGISSVVKGIGKTVEKAADALDN